MDPTGASRGFCRSLCFCRLCLLAFADLALGVESQELGELAQGDLERDEVVDGQREGVPIWVDLKSKMRRVAPSSSSG